MDKEKLKDFSIEQLKNKEKSLKIFIGVFIPLIIGLFYFIIRDYYKGEAVDWSILTIAICTLGGPVTLYPELKEVQKELMTRNN
jgi:RsiW-degrading membrane proteinase PrsW (M82 family)